MKAYSLILQPLIKKKQTITLIKSSSTCNPGTSKQISTVQYEYKRDVLDIIV